MFEVELTDTLLLVIGFVFGIWIVLPIICSVISGLSDRKRNK